MVQIEVRPSLTHLFCSDISPSQAQFYLVPTYKHLICDHCCRSEVVLLGALHKLRGKSARSRGGRKKSLDRGQLWCGDHSSMLEAEIVGPRWAFPTCTDTNQVKPDCPKVAEGLLFFLHPQRRKSLHVFWVQKITPSSSKIYAE